MRSLCLLLALAIAGTAGSSRAEIYRWVDESGHTRFSDRIEDVPPAWRKNVEQQIHGGAGSQAMPERTAKAPAPAPGAAARAATPKPAKEPAPPPASEPASALPGLPVLGGASVAGLIVLALVLRRRRPLPAPVGPSRRP
jgi:hypothetical protein